MQLILKNFNYNALVYKKVLDEPVGIHHTEVRGFGIARTCSRQPLPDSLKLGEAKRKDKR